MNPITGWLVAIALLTISLAVGYVGAKLIKSKDKEIKLLEGELEQAKTNIAYLYRNAKEIAKIEKDEKKVSEEIKNAKSDEEIFDIINTVIAANNDRVRK